MDDNQKAIVEALRKAGVSIAYLHSVGMGCPDILAGFRGRNVLLEIKDGSKPPSARKLTPMQERWHQIWDGQVCVVTSEEEALRVMFDAGRVPFEGSVM